MDLEKSLKKLDSRTIRPGAGGIIRGVPAVMRQLATHPDVSISSSIKHFKGKHLTTPSLVLMTASSL